MFEKVESQKTDLSGAKYDILFIIWAQLILKCKNLFSQPKTYFFQTEMNLIFIYLIVQSHAISPFATFGKFFSNFRVRGRKPSSLVSQPNWAKLKVGARGWKWTVQYQTT